MEIPSSALTHKQSTSYSLQLFSFTHRFQTSFVRIIVIANFFIVHWHRLYGYLIYWRNKRWFYKCLLPCQILNINLWLICCCFIFFCCCMIEPKWHKPKYHIYFLWVLKYLYSREIWAWCSKIDLPLTKYYSKQTQVNGNKKNHMRKSPLLLNIFMKTKWQKKTSRAIEKNISKKKLRGKTLWFWQL